MPEHPVDPLNELDARVAGRLMRIMVRNEADVSRARRIGARAAELLELPGPIRTRFAIAISEVARLLQQTGTGEMGVYLLAEGGQASLEARFGSHPPFSPRNARDREALQNLPRLVDILELPTEQPAPSRLAVSLASPSMARESEQRRLRDQLLREHPAPAEEVRRQNQELSTAIAEIERQAQALRQAKDEAEYLARHDALTGLPNRAWFTERLQVTVAEAAQRGLSLALLYVDLDNFKWINDALGHAAGDEMLFIASHRMRDAVRDVDTVGRLGGDEFAIILPLANAEQGGQDAATIAERVVQAFRKPVELEGRRVYSAASVGLALFPEDAGNHEELMAAADLAMYQAKANGRDRVQDFDTHLVSERRRSQQLAQAVREWAPGTRMQVQLHPVVDAEQRVCGSQASLHWEAVDAPMDWVAATEAFSGGGRLEELMRWWCGELAARTDEYPVIGVPVNRTVLGLGVQTLSNIIEEAGIRAVQWRIQEAVFERARGSEFERARALAEAHDVWVIDYSGRALGAAALKRMGIAGLSWTPGVDASLDAANLAMAAAAGWPCEAVIQPPSATQDERRSTASVGFQRWLQQN